MARNLVATYVQGLIRADDSYAEFVDESTLVVMVDDHTTVMKFPEQSDVV